MGTELDVDIQHVTKIYRLGAERSNWRALVPGPFGEQPTGEAFHALTDVSLQIEAGEALGIIGANGAGKSTILKILAGVVEPTYGSVEIRGQVAPIIELGVGFDPELNGSENVRFGGALLGHDAQELEERYESIVAFSGLEDFMETPVKRYSTGMRARLGFSLVTAFDADLILLDEVLSVGDFDFQNRSRFLHRLIHQVLRGDSADTQRADTRERRVKSRHLRRILREENAFRHILQYHQDTTLAAIGHHVEAAGIVERAPIVPRQLVLHAFSRT